MEHSLSSLEDSIPDSVVVEVGFDQLNPVLGIRSEVEEEFIFLFVGKGADGTLDFVTMLKEDVGDMLSDVSINASDDNWDVLIEFVRGHF